MSDFVVGDPVVMDDGFQTAGPSQVGLVNIFQSFDPSMVNSTNLNLAPIAILEQEEPVPSNLAPGTVILRFVN